ncbi:MAG TPA: (4Fe-4S)-binding protein [Desulfobacteraceae bacterium]|nr:(4Fe-4S)-binding protein [Desulfobacteraceae bacterium]
MEERKKKIVKQIKIDADKCNGCRACEAVCSAFHSDPKYGTINPERARIKVHFDPLRNMFVPVFAGPYTASECMGRNRYIIDGKEYDECLFCRASCPSREIFKEPDSGLPLKCDMCENEPPLEQPRCVEVCLVDALTYEEREEEGEEEERPQELDMGLEALIDKFGLDKVMDSILRISSSKKEQGRGLK